MSLTVFFDTIYEFHCTILIHLYLYLQYFLQKILVSSK